MSFEFKYIKVVKSCGDCPDYRPSEKNMGYFICEWTGNIIDDEDVIDETCPERERD